MARRFALGFLLLLLAGLVSAAPLTREERRATIAFVNSLQNDDGGYRGAPMLGRSTVGTSVSGLRAIHYLGGTPQKQRATAAFLNDCYDKEAGSFSDTPGGEATVRTTAMGVMASAELKLPMTEKEKAILGYFATKAKTLPDIYIAAASLDAARIKAPKAPEWTAAYEATRKPDGTYGATSRETASAVITILRLGGNVSNREAVARALKGAQAAEGGFAVEGEGPSLQTTYPMMRALYMLKEKPDLTRLREFVARCRNADGGYGLAPGQPSTGQGTYYAAIVLHWADELERGPGKS